MTAIDTDAACEHLLSDHRELVEATLSCADRVAESWDEDGTTDRTEVVEPFESLLRETGLLGAYPSALAECVRAAGGELRASPVAAPPYVVVTSVGVVLRVTLATGRLVVTVEAFEVGNDREIRYARAARQPEDAIRVEFRVRTS